MEAVLVGAFVRVFIRRKGPAVGTTKGKWVIVQITGIVNVEPYVLKDAGAKLCKVKLEITRTKKRPGATENVFTYETSSMAITLDNCHPYFGNDEDPQHGLDDKTINDWLDNQSPDVMYKGEGVKDKKTQELKYAWDHDMEDKERDFNEYLDFEWSEDRIDNLMAQKREEGITMDSKLRQATEKRQLIKEIQDQLANAGTKQGEDIDEKKVESLKAIIAQKQHELDAMEADLEQERRHWEGKNQSIFGVLNIVKRNREAQNEADKYRDPLPPSLRKGAEGMNPEFDEKKVFKSQFVLQKSQNVCEK